MANVKVGLALTEQTLERLDSLAVQTGWTKSRVVDVAIAALDPADAAAVWRSMQERSER